MLVVQDDRVLAVAHAAAPEQHATSNGDYGGADGYYTQQQQQQQAPQAPTQATFGSSLQVTDAIWAWRGVLGVARLVWAHAAGVKLRALNLKP